MSGSIRHRVLRLGAWLVAGLLLAGPALAETLPASEVLTLEEAATLLRSPRDAIESLATSGDLPGRQIAGEWRFSRRALLAWLGAPGEADGAPGTALASDESARIRGRGVEGGASGSPPDEASPVPGSPSSADEGGGPDAEATTYGEERSGPSAEEVFLSTEDLVTLPAGRLTMELGLAYSKGDQRRFQLSLDDEGSLGVAEIRQDAEAFLYSATARYGLPWNLELIGSLPWSWSSETSHVGQTNLELASRREWDLGPPSLQLQHQILREGEGRPSLLASLRGVIPRKNRPGAIGAGLSLVKSLDPVVLFGSVDYQRNFNPDVQGDAVRFLQPENQVNAVLGYSIALNESFQFGNTLEGLFTTTTHFGEFSHGLRLTEPGDETFLLRFNATAHVMRNLWVQPSLAFQLTDPGSQVLVGVNLPYTFIVPPLRW